ncbi:MAG: glycosyltransferase [Verrucomicrobiota bacterium]|nr:glycosyltransferase [Verrucomicrobiota bacterium]
MTPEKTSTATVAKRELPLISVCLPVYNSAEYIEAAIASVVAQTYGAWELIIVDDCSTDETSVVLDRIIAGLGDSRILRYTNSTRLGMVGNWNRSVSLATGEFIKLIGQDDVLKRDCLANQARGLIDHPSVTVVGSARQVVNAAGRPIMVRRCFPGEGIYDGRETIRRCLSTGTNIIGEPVSILFRTISLAETEPFSESITYCTDLDMWLRLLTFGDFYYIPEPQTLYRIHDGAATRKLENEVIADFFRLADRMIATGYFQLSPTQRRFLAVKVRLLGFARRLIYRLLARG